MPNKPWWTTPVAQNLTAQDRQWVDLRRQLSQSECSARRAQFERIQARVRMLREKSAALLARSHHARAIIGGTIHALGLLLIWSADFDLPFM